MSEEIKMKTLFPHVFQVEGNPCFGVQHCVWTTFGEDQHSTASQDSAIEHAVLNHDRLTKLETDRKNAISKMSKSWRHDAESRPDLLSDFVDMANRQFDILQQQKSENAELREAIGSLHQIATIFAGDSYSKTLLESEVKKLLMTHK